MCLLLSSPKLIREEGSSEKLACEKKGKGAAV
jgi:hypothetical protein